MSRRYSNAGSSTPASARHADEGRTPDGAHPRFELETFLPYLVNRVGSTIAQMYARDVAHYELTVPMWRVLSVLIERDELRLVDLSEATSIDASTLSRLTSTMQRRRLISRRRSRTNRRELMVSIAPRGRDVAAALIPTALAYEQAMTEGIAEADLETTRRTLRAMFERLAALRARSGNRNGSAE